MNGKLIVIEGSDASGKHTQATQLLERLKKEGFEALSVTVDFISRNQVLYLRMISVGQLLRKAEQALDQREIGEAKEFLARVEAIEADNPVMHYIRALIKHVEGDNQQAALMLVELAKNGYAKPVVILTLADIYQYQLKDRKKAITYLEEYLRLVKD